MNARMLAAAALFAMTVAGARAHAETAPGAAAPPATPVKICTTTTTVVRRGDVVISNASTTKCEDEGASGGGTARAVFGASETTVKTILSAGILAGGGDSARASNVRGDWRVVQVKTGQVCHFRLTGRPAVAGFQAHGVGCAGPISRIDAWTFDNGDVVLHARGGDVVLRLAGDRDHLAGMSASGDRFELTR